MTTSRTLRILHVRVDGMYGCHHFQSRQSDDSLSDQSDPEYSDSDSSDDVGAPTRTRDTDTGHWQMLTDESHEFMQFAFGPEGPPSLEVIAIGKFRNGQTGALLVRNTQQDKSKHDDSGCLYRSMSPKDYEQNDLVDKYRDTLASLPLPS
jgi:hypothetical protein